MAATRLLGPSGAGTHGGSVDVDVSPCGRHVRVSGRLDAQSAGSTRDQLRAAVDAAPGDLVLQLANAEIGDTVGLGVLVGVHRHARRNGRRLVLGGVSPRTERLLRAAKVHRLLMGPQHESGSVAPVTG